MSMYLNTLHTAPPPFLQGEPKFVQELKSYDPRKAHWDTGKKAQANSLDLCAKWVTEMNFPDP